MDRLRIYASIALPFVSLIVKWLAVTFRRGIGNGKARGHKIPGLEIGRQFRFIGWDLASASMGMYVAALVAPESGLRRSIADRLGDFGNLVWIGCFLYYALLLIVCALLRYATQEVMEKYREREWRWAFVSWALGAYLIALTGKWAAAVR
jgi:hypothetical protein